ncbi:hypothetical protein ETAA8_44720 [Anatilimnocola aggregata]|uniref:Uncharacterized protein n=1 Tax=Anatilimnocola aggregata TaxID=2528021 RepID=A0A517YGK4_9BACT|nr:hypothetical protein [Anatilimnocola aggregata]QDU29363.1 hypothetical protein ETAA8_44720 [Anatilimnocola aggregata]
MRLTLATLLAYLDNVLEPADSQALAEKIEKSDFASGLVMRIRSISRKLRMGAPKVEGKGLGRDPNSVAEYLDGSLAPERIGEFERLCLESDVQLAEVASCHQVLAMVLNKPADVPANLRERVYELAKKAEAARLAGPSRLDSSHSPIHDGAPPVPPKPSSAATSATTLQPPSENGKVADPVAPPVAKTMVVPDYLKAAQGSGNWLWAVALATVFLIAVGALRLMGPFDGTHPLAKLLGMGGATVAVVPAQPNGDPLENPNPILNPNANSVPPPLVPGIPADPAENPGRATLPGDQLPVLNPPMPLPGEGVPPLPIPVTPVPVEPAPGEARTVDPVDVKPIVPPPPMPLPVPPPVDPLTPAEPKPLEPIPVEPKPIEPMPTVVPAEEVDAGRYTSDEQVLAQLVADPKMKTNLWYRLAPRSPLTSGQRFIVLPSYRPHLTLATGLQAMFAGESAFRMDKPTQPGSAAMTIEYGRVVLVSVGAAGGQIELNLAGLKGVVTLADADAAVAIEVRRFLPPGISADDPRAELVRVIDLFALGGRVVWQPTGDGVDKAEAIEIPASQVVIYLADELPRMAGPFEQPTWVDAKSLPDIERRASLDMEAELPLDKPLDIALAEHATGRRVEIRSLASRSLAALDQFEPILAELNDPRQYSYWAADIDSLRLALTRSTDTAGRVFATLQNQRPENAKLVYEMLLGASDEQLTSGAAEKLVKALESSDNDVRVVALDSLRRITGLMLMYRPEKPLASNTTSIQKWREKLKDNLITNRIPPSPLNEYKPLTP